MEVLAKEINPSSGLLLAGRLHDQDHTRTEDSDVAVVALEGGHGSLVGSGDGVEGLAILNFVANDVCLFGMSVSICVVGLGRTGGALIARAGLCVMF